MEDINVVLNKYKTLTGRRWGFDVFNCPIDLFEYLAAINMAYKLERNSEKPSKSTLNKIITIGHAVKAWQWLGDTSDPQYHLAQVWRSGILLYLIRLFSLPHNIFNTKKALNDALHHAEAIPDMTSGKLSIIWPLFQAGLSLPHGEHAKKSWLIKEVNANFRTLGCSHDRRVIDELEQAWSAHHVHCHHLA